jgi:multiple sugar transport system substrate-binding protein
MTLARIERRLVSRRKLLQSMGIISAGALIAACAPVTPAQPADSASGGEASASQETVSIKYQQRSSAAEDFVRNKFAPQFQEETGIEVILEDIPNAEYFDKIVVLAAADQLGDLIFGFTYPWLPSWASKNLMQPLDELVAADNFDLGQFYEGVINACRFEGALYGLPTVAHPSSVNLYFNRTMLEEAGVSAPDAASPEDSWSYDDILTNALAVTSEPDRWGYWFSTDFSLYTMANIRAWGTDLLSADGTQAMTASPEGIEMYQHFQDLIYVHNVTPSPEEAGGNDQSAMFTAGTLAMFTSATSQITTFGPQIEERFEWGAFPMPPGPGGSRGATVFGNTTSITQQAKEVDAAFEFLKYITSHEAGVEKLLMGSGSPGARPDVFQDPQIVETYPWYEVGHKVMLEAQAPIIPPNARTAEIYALVPQMESQIWLNQVTGEEGAKQLAEAIDQILAQPR